MTILEMSAGGALLIAVILLLRRLALHRLPKWTFLLLWAVAVLRLLAPFSLPSKFSVYTGVARLLEQEKASEPSESQPPVILPPATVPGTFREDVWVMPAVPDIPAPTPEKVPVSPLAAVYLTGAVLCGLFFLTVYGRCMHRFHEAEPVKSDFLDRWQEEHPTLFPVGIKTCGAVSAPMACGLLRPVILLPEDTNWSNEDQLTYILTHEYVHIRRGDLFWKLLLTVAVCVHWFNPLVWAMYFCSNRDLELACDEAVVRILGLDSRKGYAYTLLFAAESGFSPFCTTYTTKNHMEERIRAIMKMKKRSAAAILAAVVLVSDVTAVFATSQAPAPKNIDGLPQAVMTTTTTRPAPAPVEKDSPTSDTSAVAGLEPTPTQTDTPDTDDRIHPVTGEPAGSAVTAPEPQESAEPMTTAVEPQESAGPTPENRWNVPDGEIPQFTEFDVDSFEDAHELGKYLEATHGLYPGDYVPGRINGNVTRYIVQITYQERAIRERLSGGVYPVNSKGQTYGSSSDQSIVGYEPDLCAVQATNGVSGYVKAHDLWYCGYQGSIETLEDMKAYMEWQNAQPKPILIPVYDVNYDNVVGYFAFSDGRNSMTQEEELEMIAEQMRNWGNSEEQIAADLEYYKQTRGWN